MRIVLNLLVVIVMAPVIVTGFVVATITFSFIGGWKLAEKCFG